LIYRCIRDCRIDPGTIDPFLWSSRGMERHPINRGAKLICLGAPSPVPGGYFASVLLFELVSSHLLAGRS
jgi:hypothetical protein